MEAAVVEDRVELEGGNLQIPQRNIWGYHLRLNMFNCNPKKIRDRAFIKQNTFDLCDLIKMKRYGKIWLEDFGDDEVVTGFTMFQAIETSNLCAHFVNQTNDIKYDVFSCKSFDADVAIKFLTDSFQAEFYKGDLVKR